MMNGPFQPHPQSATGESRTVEPYQPPPLLKNGHVQTIFPVVFRKVDTVVYTRERIETFDEDFLDLDWSRGGNKRLAIVIHGLEGNSNRAYVKGMVKALNQAGWDALAMNLRSCSGEPNRRLRSYHNGSTDDLAWVIAHAKRRNIYRKIALVGFSLGGNLILVHLGRDRVDPIVKGAVVFSVPCDIKASAHEIARPKNRIYLRRFLNMLHDKIRAKMKIMPGYISDEGFERIKDFKDFDDRYTAPIHGFRDAHDYWEKCSSKQFLPDIKIPALIVNAGNDPFLGDACFPVKEAAGNPNVVLEMPPSGGHVGFIQFNKRGVYWSEKRTAGFLQGLK